MTDSVIMASNWYVDRLNCATFLDSVTPPRLNKAAERFVAAGSWMAMSMPGEIEELTATITVRGSHGAIRGLLGYEPGDWTNLYYYERIRDIMKGINRGRVVSMTGLLQEVQQPRVTGKRAEVTTYTFGSIVTYNDMQDGVRVHYMDYETNALVMNGVDYSTGPNQLIAR